MSDHDYPPNEGQTEMADQDEPTDAPEPDLELDVDDEQGADEAAPHGNVAELNDRILRLAAELENTRRRAEREKADAGRYSIATFARDLLAVSDNFERALQAAGVTGAEAPEGRSEAFTNLVAGIRMTEKELLTVLERNGVRKLSPAGERFDPNLHQAVAQVPHADIPQGHVVDVAQSGYLIGDRVLRAAMVTVSSGAGGENPAPPPKVDTEA